MSQISYVSSIRMVTHRYSGTHKARKLLRFSNNTIGYIKKGSAEFLYNGRLLHAGEGALIYIPIGTEYSSVWTGEPEIEFYQIVFDFVNKLDAGRYCFQIIDDFPALLLDEMAAEYEESPMLSLGKFYTLLDTLYKSIAKNPNGIMLEIEPAIKHIETNYSSPISVAKLASICNMSESGFYRKFRSACGVTPINYKHNVMIRHSLELLSDTNLGVEEISDRVGFSSPNYFRRIFIKVMKKTPRSVIKARNRDYNTESISTNNSINT